LTRHETSLLLPFCACLQLPSTDEIEAMFTDRRLNTIVFFLDETFEELSYDVTGGEVAIVCMGTCNVYLCVC